jgi:oligopeptide transport system ATP-binding protein
MSCLLQVNNLKKYFPVRKGLFSSICGYVKAVDDISFHIKSGESLGLVGESGCGKTTVGRCIVGLLTPSAGNIQFQNLDLSIVDNVLYRKLRRSIQMIFQDPFSSLNPRMTTGSIIEEGLIIHRYGNRHERRKRVFELLDQVGLQTESYDLYPHEFSGGQRQRIGIARALALNPRLVICDEPVSALDVSVQAQILNLLQDLQDTLGLTYLFIAHDLAVVRHFSTRVAVMYMGKIVESAPVEALFSSPAHPYTRVLMASVPVLNPARRRERFLLEGDVPTPLNPPSGCRFNTRCPVGKDKNICAFEEPEYRLVDSEHYCACHFAEN